MSDNNSCRHIETVQIHASVSSISPGQKVTHNNDHVMFY